MLKSPMIWGCWMTVTSWRTASLSLRDSSAIGVDSVTSPASSSSAPAPTASTLPTNEKGRRNESHVCRDTDARNTSGTLKDAVWSIFCSSLAELINFDWDSKKWELFPSHQWSSRIILDQFSETRVVLLWCAVDGDATSGATSATTASWDTSACVSSTSVGVSTASDWVSSTSATHSVALSSTRLASTGSLSVKQIRTFVIDNQIKSNNCGISQDFKDSWVAFGRFQWIRQQSSINIKKKTQWTENLSQQKQQQ